MTEFKLTSRSVEDRFRYVLQEIAKCPPDTEVQSMRLLAEVVLELNPPKLEEPLRER